MTKALSQDKSPNHFWVSAGIGKSHLPSGMLAMGFEFNNKPTLVTGRYLLNTELFSSNQPGIKVSEAAVLYGLVLGKFVFQLGLVGYGELTEENISEQTQILYYMARLITKESTTPP